MIKQKITDSKLNAHLSNIEPDKIDIFLLNKSTVRGAIMHGTKMINQMRANHKLGLLETLTPTLPKKAKLHPEIDLTLFVITTNFTGL